MVHSVYSRLLTLHLCFRSDSLKQCLDHRQHQITGVSLFSFLSGTIGFSVPLHYRHRQVATVWPSFTVASSLSLALEAPPGCLSLQHTLLTAAPLIFARTLPYSRMFCGSPLSTKLNHKCISLLISASIIWPQPYFPLSFAFLHPSIQPQWMSGYCPNMPGSLSLLCCFLYLAFLCRPSASVEILPSLQGPVQMHFRMKPPQISPTWSEFSTCPLF